MKTRLFIIFMLLFSSSCLHSKPEATENKNQNINLTKDNTDFACRLYANLKTPGENLFFSPFSISSALTMTYIGSENNTANEMKSVMQLSMEKNELNDSYRNLMNDLNSLQKNGGIRLLNSNALWPHKEY